MTKSKGYAMRSLSALLLSLLLCACGSLQQKAALPAPEVFFHDQLFAEPAESVDASQIFALSDSMRDYLRNGIAHQLRTEGRQRGLLDALYKRGQLKLEYDSGITRNAAQAFDARAGNCLSLVIMTAAFAKELGLPVEFQSAFLEETWSRQGGLLFRSGHVNVTLGHRVADIGAGREASSLTVDFLGADDIRGLRTRVISEETVVAMYANNRAAESLVRGDLDTAYAWARESMRHQSDFMSAHNTLGVVYMRHGNLAEAAAVFNGVLQREPENTRAMSNLALVLQQQGKGAESAALLQRMAAIDPNPPFHYFNLGLTAMEKGDYRSARDFFAREVSRAEYYHEFQFWLGLANYKLGQIDEARRHLRLAMENSTTRHDHDLYEAKLSWLRLHSTTMVRAIQ
ncbi:tetratricopeptide repeat protein [Piscinibacter terrae]|nr:tetratricopeptide repeat protein [Albitalea terrae]